MTIYSLDVLLSRFETGLLLLDLNTGFTGGRSGGVVSPSLEEFSTVCCDPHSQRLWHSQWSRGRCFSGILLFSLWSNWMLAISSAFPKSSLNIWKFSVHILLNPCLENFEHYFASVWDECNFAVVWTFFELTVPTLIKSTLLLKNVSHHLSLQQVIIIFQ